MAAAARTTTSTFVLAAVLVSLSLSLRGADVDAARLTPGDSPIVATCMTGPHPDLCVNELGQRLLEIQTAIASVASGQGAAKIAGAPGHVDPKALVNVAMEAASEAGTVLTSIFEGKLPGFNTGVPDFKKCLSNCTVTMKAAMQKLKAAKVAANVGGKQVAKALSQKALADVSSCNVSCKDMKGDVHLILSQSLTEFTKMMQIALGFIGKMKDEPPSPPSTPSTPPEKSPPSPPTPEARRTSWP